MDRASILDEIVANKRRELSEQETQVLGAELERALAHAPPARDFTAALRAPGVSLIAEVKRASPSRGLLRADLNSVELAKDYASHGAAAISVLTETRYFLGSLADLSAVSASVGLPVLRKDFMFSPYQMVEARAAGADAVLLIAAILETNLLRELRVLAESLGMAALVEVHDEQVLARALDAGATVIGINNRDLKTFRVDLETTRRLRRSVPSDCSVVSESGIRSSEDVRKLRDWGVDAMLVGEALVQAPDLPAKLAELTLCS